MSVSMNHDQVRVFAQLLRELTGRDVRHSQILKQIAAAKYVAYDALMHRLKNNEAERVELDATNLQSVATSLSALSRRLIEIERVKKAAALSIEDASTPDISSTWATFKRNAQGKIAFLPFTPEKPGDRPHEDFGFSDVNLVDASRIAQIISKFGDGSSKEPTVEISSPFTLKLLVVKTEGNAFKSSGLQAVDSLVNALTGAFAPEGMSYIVDGCVFRPAALRRVPTVTADLTRAIEQLQPLFKKIPITVTSGHQKPSSVQRPTHSDHNHSSPFTLLRHTLNGMIFLQSIPPNEWRKEIDAIEMAARDLTFQGHSGPLNDYKRLIQSLFGALKVIVGIYELVSMTVEDERWEDVKGLLSLIDVGFSATKPNLVAIHDILEDEWFAADGNLIINRLAEHQQKRSDQLASERAAQNRSVLAALSDLDDDYLPETSEG